VSARIETHGRAGHLGAIVLDVFEDINVPNGIKMFRHASQRTEQNSVRGTQVGDARASALSGCRLE